MLDVTRQAIADVRERRRRARIETANEWMVTAHAWIRERIRELAQRGAARDQELQEARVAVRSFFLEQEEDGVQAPTDQVLAEAWEWLQEWLRDDTDGEGENEVEGESED